MKVLVAGWFSFEDMGASAGDLLARDLTCRWLQESNCAFDIAVAAPFSDGCCWEETNPSEYSHVLFVCGPFGNGEPLIDFLEHFSGCKLIGVNLTMLQALSEWNPFDFLLERDSSRMARPDIALGADRKLVPVVGIILIDHQPEYGSNDLHQEIDRLIWEFVETNSLTPVRIDTRLDTNSVGLRSSEEIESLIAKMDVVITTRLHGLVLSIKNRVPVVAIDAVRGGAKITRQSDVLQWPLMIPGESLSLQRLQETYDFCLTEDCATKVQECADSALQAIREVGEELNDYLKRQI